MRETEKRSRRNAKTLRRQMTRAEVILWSRLRRNAVHGCKFRRQHPVGPYIADFACALARIIVEVDGETHASDEELTYDRRRDTFLRDHGWQVFRIRNEEVFRNLDRVMERVFSLVPPPPA